MEKDRIIQYLKKLSKRVNLEVIINGYDFEAVKTLKGEKNKQRYEGTIDDNITLHDFKQSIQKALALRIRRNNLQK